VRERRNYLIVLGVIVAALIGVGMLAIPGSPAHKSPTLGLDLRGGLEVVLKAVPPKAHQLTQGDLDRSVSIMRSRIDKLGVSEPEIRKQGSNQIVIQLAGVHDPATAAQLIGKTAQLEFYDLQADLTGPSIGANGVPVETTSLYGLLAGQQQKAKHGTPTAYYVFNPKRRLVANGGPFDTRAAAEQRAARGKGLTILAVPEGRIVITCGGPNASAAICPGGPQGQGANPAVKNYYLFNYDPISKTHPIPEMTGADLQLSGTRQDFDQNGQPNVLIDFTGKGSHKFQEITRGLYQRGQFRQTPQNFAIVLDGEIASFPQIDFRDSTLSNGISGSAQITGIRSLGEAKRLALVLQTGALPVEFEQIERTDVSATLGKDSLQQAKTAALIGLLVVALFLLVLYRFLGVIAVLGLAIYAAFLYAAILIFNVTMTLPGFAGLILTIGVAADANVVIFERIKEEVRSGKSIRAAIAAGYQKGFHTIIDANVVTAITALVLFLVATAQVKGFALMLLIGTVISLVTAVGATRAMLGLLAGFRWFNNPRFMGASGQQRGRFLQIDFMGRRNVWFAISGTVIAISIISLAVRGLNLGIDFKGGTQITFKTPEPVAIGKVRDQMASIGRRDAVVQGRGSSSGDRYKSFQVRTKSLTAAQQNTLSSELKQNLGATASGVKNVSSSFGRQIARLAILAIVVSLALIVFYIALRFDLKFAIPVLVALAHDIVITLGVYSLSAREVTTATVAAVLTVLGYSIYDTIIIFDRVRENIPLMRRASFATIANVSLWETIRRSLATTFITLLPVISLLLFGGDTLKDFAFALLVGITSGAYSSIFVAAPLLTVLKEREPEYRRRVGSDVVEKGVGGVADVALAEGAVRPDDEGRPARRWPLGPRERPEAPAAPAPEPAPAALAEATEASGAPIAPSVGELAPQPSGSAQAKREKRRQRRRTRPHGRAR
jgi:SecD/SecF fusion protein